MADFVRTSYGTKYTPYTEPEWKIPGCTVHMPGIIETYKKTPIAAQHETLSPELDDSSFVHTRTMKEPVPIPHRDPTNDPEILKKPLPDNLWPRLQERAVQKSFKPPQSNIVNGDYRIPPFHTSYSKDFAPAFPAHETIRSPMRNPDLAAAGTLKQQYTSAFNRVTEKRLKKMIASMAERLAAKLGNSNDNAFRMRRLFKMYDKEKSGLLRWSLQILDRAVANRLNPGVAKPANFYRAVQIELEDFRQFMESFGIQLDDDSLLALFYKYDEQGTGTMKYEELMKALLDPDYFALYIGNVDNTQAKVDATNREKLVQTIRSKFTCSFDDMLAVFRSMDVEGTGMVQWTDFLSCCAALGITLNDKEKALMMSVVEYDDASNVKYSNVQDLLVS